MSNIQAGLPQSTPVFPVYPGAQPLGAERAMDLAANPERQRLVEQMLSATTAEEIAAARQAQDVWLAANPDDFGILEAGETLAYAEEALFGDALPDRAAVTVDNPTVQTSVPHDG